MPSRARDRPELRFRAHQSGHRVHQPRASRRSGAKLSPRDRTQPESARRLFESRPCAAQPMPIRGGARAIPPRHFIQPLWRGEPLAGKTVLLHAEQGFGDSLMLLRYAPMVAARGGRVVIEVPKALVRLAKRLAGGPFPVIAEGAPLPAFDVHCALMSLPLALGTTPETIPAQVPYLFPAPEDILRWKERLGDTPGLKVGIAW